MVDLLPMTRKRIFLTALLLILLAGTGCQLLGIPAAPQPTPSSKIKTIHPATLTAISESARLTPTPDSDLDLSILDEADRIRLVFWFDGEKVTEQQAMARIVAKYNRENPHGITVEMVSTAGGMIPEPDQASAQLAQDEPGFLLLQAPALAAWGQQGELVDLNRFIEDPLLGWDGKNLEQVHPILAETLQTDQGNRLAVPFSLTMQVMFYNRSWAEELGFSEPPQTSGELREQVCASARDYLEKNPQAGRGMGGLLLYPAAENLIPWLAAYGGKFFSPQTNQYLLNQTEFRRVALEWWLMQQRGCAYGIHQAPNPMLDERGLADFNARRALVIMGPAADFSRIYIPAGDADLPDTWAMMPFLGPQGEKAVAAQVQAAGIPPASPEQQLAAWLFLDFLSSPEIQAAWVEDTGHYPVREDVIDLLDDHRRWHPHWAQGLEFLPYLQPEPQVHSWEVVGPMIGDGTTAILKGGYQEIFSILEELEETAVELHSKQGQ